MRILLPIFLGLLVSSTSFASQLCQNEYSVNAQGSKITLKFDSSKLPQLPDGQNVLAIYKDIEEDNLPTLRPEQVTDMERRADHHTVYFLVVSVSLETCEIVDVEYHRRQDIDYGYGYATTTMDYEYSISKIDQ